MNRITLIGNLTKDVELSKTNNGKSVAKFGLATQRKYSNSDGEREADFHNIVVWNTQAENCKKYISKGSKVAVVGEVRYRSYETDKGEKKYITEIYAEEIEFLNTKKSNTENEDDKSDKEDDNLPF